MIVVDRLLCEANGVCVRECPEAFEIEDSQALVIKTADVPGHLEDRVRQAVASCPRQALSVVHKS